MNSAFIHMCIKEYIIYLVVWNLPFKKKSKLFALSPQRMTWIRRQNAIAGVKHITVHHYNKIIALEHYNSTHFHA